MGGIGDIVKDVRTRHAWWLNYPPGSGLQLGDIVVPYRGTWVVVDNLEKSLGIDIGGNRTNDPVTDDPWILQSEGTIKIEGKASADPGDAFKFLANGKAGAKVTFSGERQYLLSLSNVSFPRIESLSKLWDAITGSGFSRWTWDLRKRIVTHVVEAGSGTFLTSASGEKAFELEAEGEVKAGPVPAGDVSAGFKLASAFSSAEMFAARQAITPLFRCARVRVLGLSGGLQVASLEDQQTELVVDDDPSGADSD